MTGGKRWGDVMRGYRQGLLPASTQEMGHDLVAALAVAAVAIPEQIATARLAGMPATAGLLVFVVGSLGFYFLGSNRFLSVGADSTIAPIFAASLALLAASGTPHYMALCAMFALLVGWPRMDSTSFGFISILTHLRLASESLRWQAGSSTQAMRAAASMEDGKRASMGFNGRTPP